MLISLKAYSSFSASRCRSYDFDSAPQLVRVCLLPEAAPVERDE